MALLFPSTLAEMDIIPDVRRSIFLSRLVRNSGLIMAGADRGTLSLRAPETGGAGAVAESCSMGRSMVGNDEAFRGAGLAGWEVGGERQAGMMLSLVRLNDGEAEVCWFSMPAFISFEEKSTCFLFLDPLGHKTSKGFAVLIGVARSWAARDMEWGSPWAAEVRQKARLKRNYTS